MSHKMKAPIIFMLLIVFITSVSATITCQTTNPIHRNYQTNSISSETFTIATICQNIGNDSVTSTISSPSSFFTLEDHPFTLDSGEAKGSLRINFNTNTPVGNYTGHVTLGEVTIPISLNVTPIPQPTTGCQLNPSIIAYTQTVQQGTNFELPKITFNPTNCIGDLSITSSYVSGGITTTQGQKPTYIKSASSTDVLLGVNTEGLSSLTYTSKLTVVAFGKTFPDVSTITIIVTGGTNPQGTFSANNMPVCSLSSNTFNINSSYNLVCTNLIPDVTIEPIVDSDYIKGLSLDTSQTQFVWSFSPKKFGNTKIKAQFKYLGVPVGEVFEQEIKIQSSSGAVPGTELYIEFTPAQDKIKNNEEVILQVLDNKSRSLVENPELYINSLLVENKTGKSFRYKFETGKNYNIRAVVPGYSDLAFTFTPTEKPIAITISPDKGNARTMFNISTDVNATIYIDGVLQNTFYYGTLTGSEHNITAYKEGYTDTNRILKVDPVTEFFTTGEFKKGVLQSIGLSKNATWTVYYQKNSASSKEIYNSLTGTGSKIEFEPSKSGIYTVETDDGSVFTREIAGTNWNAKWWFMAWYWWIIIVALVIGIFVMRSNGHPDNVDVGFRGNVNY